MAGVTQIIQIEVGPTEFGDGSGIRQNVAPVGMMQDDGQACRDLPRNAADLRGVDSTLLQAFESDGAEWILGPVEQHCPNATICLDPFHVVAWALKALDKVRARSQAGDQETPAAIVDVFDFVPAGTHHVTIWTDAPVVTKIGLYRVLQEALSNAARHAGGSAIEVELSLVDAGAVDIVIIAKLDRLTRSVKDLAELLEMRDGGGGGQQIVGSHAGRQE